MNPSKCKFMRFSPKSCPLSHSGPSSYSTNGTSLNYVEYHSDLGVTIDRDLKFHCHDIYNVLAMSGLASILFSCALRLHADSF